MRNVSIISPPSAPIPRQIEVARPDVDPTPAGGVLVSNVVYRISPIGDGPAVCDHPAVQVLVSLETDGDDATVTVPIAGLASNGCASDPIGQRKACLLPATPAFARWARAKLAAFGRINAVQANSLAVNLNGIAVDYGGDAGDVFLCGG